MNKETTDTMEKAGKTFYEICVRLTLYGGAFVLVGIAGFFIYDVPIPRSRYEIDIDGDSRRHITLVDRQMRSIFRFWH